MGPSSASHRQTGHMHTHGQVVCTCLYICMSAIAHMARLGTCLGCVVASRTLHGPPLSQGHRPHHVCGGNRFVGSAGWHSPSKLGHTQSSFQEATWNGICHSDTPRCPSMAWDGGKLTLPVKDLKMRVGREPPLKLPWARPAPTRRRLDLELP